MFSIFYRVSLSSIAVLLSALILLLYPDFAWAEAPFLLGKGNLENEVLYYITVDRFFDGESHNNIPDYAFPIDPGFEANLGIETGGETIAYNQVNRTLIEQTYDPSHRYIRLYWGGDLEGVIAKLDYLQNLGVTQLVLSPIQDSANGFVYSPQGKSAYLHARIKPGTETFSRFYAYAGAGVNAGWTRDWFEIDEHFRNPQDQTSDRFRVLRRLLNEAGNRGIGIILELNLNHTSPYRTSLDYAPFDPERYETWMVDQGAVYRHGKRLATYWDDATGAINPQGWFHEPIAIDYNRPTPEMLENGPVGGLPDLDQNHPEVNRYLLDAVEFWLQFNKNGKQISGFYLTSIPNINVKFWKQLETKILAVNPQTILIADYENGGYHNKNTVNWYEQTSHYSLVNYDLSVASRRFFGRDRGWDGRTIVLRENLLGQAGQYYNYNAAQKLLHYIFNPSESLEVPRHSLDVIAPEDAQAWVNFVEITDLPRQLTYYPKMTEESYASSIKFLFTSAGIPMLTYGVETGLALPYHVDHQSIFGMGGKPFNQQMMIWPGDDGWNSNLYAVTQKMAHLRQQYPVLRYGETQFLFPDNSKPDKDIFMLRAFSNCLPDQVNCAKILYAYSTEGGDFLLSLEDQTVTTIKDVDSAAIFTPVSNLLAISLKPEESKVLILN